MIGVCSSGSWASTAIINATEVGLDGVAPNSMFGDRVTDEINWADHDPATLANNLRGMNILMDWGNGEPGPLDPSPPNPGAISIEALVNRDNIDFQNRLQALGILAFYDACGPGTHSWPYWTRDLQQSIGPVMEAFAHPPLTPKRITYTTTDASYAVYGWSVRCSARRGSSARSRTPARAASRSRAAARARS